MAQTATLIIRAALEQKKSIYREIEIEGSKSLYNLPRLVAASISIRSCLRLFTAGSRPAKMCDLDPRFDLR